MASLELAREGELALAEAVVYLAMAPKSNAVYVAYNEARACIKGDRTRPVPLRLRNAPTSLMKGLDDALAISRDERKLRAHQFDAIL